MPEHLNAGDLCLRAVATALRTLEVREAARLMREQHVGCLVVVDDAHAGRVPVGMLTDRDIVTAIVAQGMDPGSLRVEDVMSAAPALAHHRDSIPDVLAAMRRSGVRRLPVVDGLGVLMGVLTLDDVLEAIAEQLSALVEAMRSGRTHEARLRP